MITKALAVCGVVAAVLLPLAWVVLGALDPHFNLVDNDGSDLGALGARYAATWNLIISASGILVMLCSIALLRALARSVAATFGSLIVTVAGAGLFIDGRYRENCSPATNEACLKAVEAWHISGHFQVHIIESIVTFVAFISASLVLRVAFRASQQWQDLAPLSLLMAGVQIVSEVVLTVLSGAGLSGQGIVEFVAMIAGMAWLGLVAVRVTALSGKCETDETGVTAKAIGA